MQGRKANYIVVIIILSIAAVSVIFVSSLKQSSPMNVKLLEFPLDIGFWKGKVLPPNEKVNKVLGTDKILMREYINPQKEIVWFCVVYGEKNRISFHPPESCYLGSGNVELLDKGIEKVKIDEQNQIAVNKLLFQMGREKQLVLYFYTAGNRMIANYYKQQFYFVLDEIKYRKSRGALVRVSTPLINDDIEDAFRRLTHFLQTSLPLLPSYL